MEDKIEKLTTEEVDVEALEARLELLDPGMTPGYYCYGDG